MKLSEILIYIVKSLAPINVSSGWGFGHYGLKHDHCHMVVRTEDGRFISQRTFPKMALLKPGFRNRCEDGLFYVERPGGQKIWVPLDNYEGTRRLVSVHEDYGIPAIDQGDTAARFFTEFLGMDVRLVRIAHESDRRTPTGEKIAFHDGWPILVVSKPSVRDFNSVAKLEIPVTETSFRPQFVFDECEPYQEDALSRFMIGNVLFEGQTLCVRCQVPDVVQETGERRTEGPVAKALEIHRGGRKPGAAKDGAFFGKNASFTMTVGSNSTIQAGMEVGVILTDRGIAEYRYHRIPT